MNWTKEQQRAIELRNKNILVAAAAGSGKTAVLVERIKRLILEDRCPIDRMLIVTFTNAAAAEMKEKIEKAIGKSINEIAERTAARGGEMSDEDRHDLVFLKKQVDLLPAANISTFHAFALDVIHRYFYLTDMEPNFRICDTSQQTILKGQAMDMLLEEYYEAGEEEFFDFLRKFSGDRNDNRLREMIEKAYDTIQSLPEPFLWLDESADALEMDLADFLESPAVRYMKADFTDSLDGAIKRLEENLEKTRADGLGGAEELAMTDMAVALELKKAAGDGSFDDIRAALENFKLPIMSKKYFAPEKNGGESVALSGIKDYMEKNRNVLKDVVSAAKKNCFYDTAENLWREVRSTAPDVRYFAGLIKEFSRLYDGLKAEKGLVDFNDIEHRAYEILKDDEAAGFFRKKFKHIFIDEYQDSNVIQEALIGTICRENNLFMVGDVKQSIYKFRLAEPEIFQGKYRAYAEAMEAMERDGEDSLSEKIDLNRNFRSKKPVIDFINHIFERTMSGYDENAALYPGDPFAENCSYQPKLFMACTPWDEDSEPDDELKLLLKAEKEALAAAKIIRDSLGKPFFDSKQGRERPLEKKDIVILMRGVKNYGDMFYRILTENGLPAYVDDNDGYFDTIEINTFMALLAIIDNKKQDVELLTVMRSEILGYSIPQLAQVRREFKEGSYYSALEAYAREGRDEALRQKAADTLEQIEKWQQMSRVLPLEELVWELMLSTGFYISMGAMPAGSQRQANLRALVDKAAGYRKTQDGSLYGFMRYIDAVKEKKVAMGQVKMAAEDDDTVRIMTIHKSKGLEFPMVLLCGFCRKLNYTSIGKNAAIHKDFGIGLPLVNYRESWFKTTLLQNAVRQRFHREEVEEEKRVLYVAMTRARDILYILGISDDPSGDVAKVIDDVPKDYSYFTMVGRTVCMKRSSWEEIFNSDLTGLSRGRKRAAAAAVRLLEQEPGPVDEDIINRLTFSYPHAKDLTVKSKYSVSELVAQTSAAADLPHPAAAASNLGGALHPAAAAPQLGGALHPAAAPLQLCSRTAGRVQPENRPIELAEPESFKLSSGFTAAQIGTITHKVLEKMDFADAAAGGISYIENLLNEMVKEEFISREEADAVDKAKLADFAVSTLGRRIAASPAVYREQPFNLVCDVDGSSALVQGIIDCFFEEDGELVLVDYKTTNVKNEAEFIRRKDEIASRYALQMGLYRRALEEATGKVVKEACLYLTNIGEVIDC